MREESNVGLSARIGQQIARLGAATAGWTIERVWYDDGRFPREAFTLSSLNFESEVESRYIGELVMKQLRDLDQVAYVRFASVYRQFKDVRDFVDELQPMLSDAPKTPR